RGGTRCTRSGARRRRRRSPTARRRRTRGTWREARRCPCGRWYPRCMDPGDLVGDRFLVERHVGSGGMGAVYQAHDDVTGLKVALKVWNGIGDNAQRFEREAQLLADLQHPAIVRYVAHGTTTAGEMWRGMQWLEG